MARVCMVSHFLALLALSMHVCTVRADTLKLAPLNVDLKALRSHEGLMISDVAEKVVECRLDDSHTVRLKQYTFRFFSQRFMDEGWYHTAHVFVPSEMDQRAKGKLFLASHVVNWRKDPDVLFEGYGKQTAAVVGVPAVVFTPNPVQRGFAKRTGLTKESQWQEETFRRFRKTGDVNLTSFAGIMVANWRALAAAENVLGTEFDKVVVAGGSKAGSAVRAMMKYDPRVVSVVCSGSIPFATEDWLRRIEAQEPLARFLAEQIKLKPEFYEHDTWFLNLGTNDFNAHPTAARQVYESLRGDVRMYAHPGGGHPARSPEQVAAMQLWLRHVFFDTRLPNITTPTAKLRDKAFHCSAEIEDPAGAAAVELCYAFYEEQPWRGPNDKRKTPHQKARWKVVPMRKDDGRYVVSLPKQSGVDLSQFHFCVRVRVVKLGMDGYLSSPVQTMKKPE